MTYEQEQVEVSCSRRRLIHQLLWVGVFLVGFFAMPHRMSSEMQVVESGVENRLGQIVEPPLEGSFVEVPTE